MLQHTRKCSKWSVDFNTLADSFTANIANMIAGACMYLGSKSGTRLKTHLGNVLNPGWLVLKQHPNTF